MGCRAALAGTALALLLAGSPAGTQENAGDPAMVYMADGASLPLFSWSLSYEYLAWKKGTSQMGAPSARRDTKELCLGKRVSPVAGTTLEIQYEPVDREREVDGQTRTVRVAVAKGLTLQGADGKKAPFRLEAPQREFLLPAGDKDLLLVPRSLDLRGQTLTGTKREICVLSFSALVECGDKPAQQVARIEFPR